MEIMGGGEETPLTIVKLCGMEVPSSGALSMSRSLHLNIGYLLRDEYGIFGI